jgi:hypothetical protein
MFGLFRKRAKDRSPVLSDADQAICDEYEAAQSAWMKAYNKRNRATGYAERAHAQAEYNLVSDRWVAAGHAHKAMMDRLTSEARARLAAQDARP